MGPSSFLRSPSLSLLGFLCLLIWHVKSSEDVQQQYRYEFKHSFKGPHLMQPDHTIPFWSPLGDTVAGDEQVRIVPSIRDKKGLVWSKYQFPYDAWKIEVDLRISGRGKIGADGMAIWYTSSVGELGSVYGSKDFFDGVGIFLDSFDNDNRGNNPFISVVLNDGTKHFEHGSDGVDEQSGGCTKDFRNRPFPVRIRAIYAHNQLSVYYSAGNFEDDDFEHCATVTDVQLPPNGYFGVSAATGGLADDHDVIRFQTWSMHEKTVQPEDAGMQEEERLKLQEDYDKNMEDFNKMQDDYKKQHPDSVRTEQHPDSLFEGAASPELVSIFEVQNAIKRDIRHLSDNLDRVLAQQDNMQRTMGYIDDAVRRLPEQQGVPAAGADDSAKKYHIDNVLNMQRESYDTVKELKNNVGTIQSMITSLEVRVQQQAQRATGAGGGDSYEAAKHRNDVQQKMYDMQNDISALLQRQPNTPKLVCPETEMPSCVSLGVLVAIAVLQVIVLIVYHSMKASREDAAKKFF